MQETIVSLLSGIMAVSNFYAILRKFKNDSPEQSSVNLKFLMDVSDIYTIRSRIGGNKSIYICKTKLKVAQVGLHPDSNQTVLNGNRKGKVALSLMVSYFALVISSYSICIRFNITTKQTPTQTEVLSSNLIRFIVARVQTFSTPSTPPRGDSPQEGGDRKRLYTSFRSHVTNSSLKAPASLRCGFTMRFFI